VRIYANPATEPAVAGKNRCFTIFHSSRELVECSGECGELVCPVNDSTTLEQSVWAEFSTVESNVVARTHTPPTCGLVLITKEVTIPCIHGEYHSDLNTPITYEVISSTLFVRSRLEQRFGSNDFVVAYLESPEEFLALVFSGGHRPAVGQDQIECNNVVHAKSVLVGLERVTYTEPETTGLTGPLAVDE